MDYTQEQINSIVAEACDAAHQAATNYFHEVLGGRDQFPCGFAWVDIFGVKGNTRLGKMLKAAGVKRSDYKKCFSIWDPSDMPVQNVDTKEHGARAAAQVFEKYGFRAYAGSRLD